MVNFPRAKGNKATAKEKKTRQACSIVNKLRMHQAIIFEDFQGSCLTGNAKKYGWPCN